MNDINAQRLELARRNARHYAADPNVKAIMVTGSVAKGEADDNSDIDCTVFYERTLTQEEFDAICQEARGSGGDLYPGTPEEGFAVYHYIEGVKCDFGHGTVAGAEEFMQEMLEKPDPDPNRQIIMSGFLACIPLYGDEWVEKWKEKLSHYPAGLAEAMVRRHLRFHPRWVVEKMGLERHDLLFVYESFLEGAGNIIGVLCGVNRLYHPGKLKGPRWVIDQMTIRPERLLERLESLFRTEPATAVEELYNLIEETLAIVEREMPEISTARVRSVIAMVLRKSSRG
jgi:hypothetical protein